MQATTSLGVVSRADEAAPKRVLVTGSGGFVGPHLVSELRRVGMEVYEVRGRADCDLSDPSASRHLADMAPEIVVHLAASPDDAASPVLASSNTLACTVNVLRGVERAGNRCRIVHAGSYKQYGSAPRPFREAVRACPDGAYGRAKHLSESLVRAAATQRISTVCLRLGPIFGPGQDSSRLVPRLIRHAQIRSLALQLVSVPWDPLYVSDAVNGILRSACIAGADGRVINLSGGRAFMPSEIARIVFEEVGAPESLSPGCVSAFCRASPSHGDISVAARVLGWRPEVDIREGIRWTIRAMAAKKSTPSPRATYEVLHG